MTEPPATWPQSDTRVRKIIEVLDHGDPEITAMGAVVKSLDGLDVEAKRRVVQWAVARWGDEIKMVTPSKKD